MKNILKTLITISRPRFWLYELGTFFIGVLAGATTQESFFDPLILAFAFFFLFPANLLIYGINDIFDYETDKLNPKKSGYEQVLPRDKHKKIYLAILITSLPFLVLSLTLPTATLICFLTFFFFAVFYSAKPIRAKTIPGFDSFFSAGHYVVTALFGYLLVGGQEINWWLILGGMAWAMAMHAYSAVPDIEADARAGLRTIATKLGKKPSILFCLFLYSLAGLVGLVFLGPLAIVLYLPYFFIMIRSIKSSESELMRLYTYFPTINSIVGMTIFFKLLIQNGWFL